MGGETVRHSGSTLDSESQSHLVSDLVQAFDWSSTPLGPASSWPPSLAATVSILLSSRFPMWMCWGAEYTMLYNDAYARTTLGKKHPWALGKPANVVWSEIWKDIGPRIDRVIETGEASWEEMLQLFLDRSGYREETYHTFSYSPIVGPEGKNSGMLCVVMEDTGRVLGERQLAELSILAAALVDANTKADVFLAIERGLADQKDIPFALVYLFDEEGLRLNQAARCGIEADHLAASSVIEVDAATCPWPTRALTSAESVTIENLGALFENLPVGSWDRPPDQARLVPFVRKGQSTPAGVFIVGVNPYRQLDGSYADFLDLLAGQIAASITNAEAYEDQRKRAETLAELDRAKTAFFSNISHELRTPLTLILGPIEDAIVSQNPPSGEALEMLHRNALRLLKMVNGLLDFVRIEAGRLQASYEPTDVSLLTSQLASVFRSAAERAGLQLVVRCAPLPEPVYLDRDMWEKIVLNLLSNALKSTFDGQILIQVEHDETYARLIVEDTGTGIPADQLPQLFERFRRIEGAKRRSHEGSGIGLALVKELVELHGGTITVESTVSIGTRFVIQIPFGQKHLSRGRILTESVNPVKLQDSVDAYVREALGWLPGQERLQQQIAPLASNDAPTGTFDVEGRKPLILLVDDNADMRQYVLSLLGGRFDVVTAADGREALEKAESLHPDLVLTDVMMPEMDGFALLSSLRERQQFGLLPVIMLSARAGEESRIEGLDAGADDYLVKPFTARELIARVEAQLKLTRVRRQAIEQKASLTLEVERARQFAWEALEHIPEAFSILDREFRITYMNPAAARLTAQHPLPHLGQTLWDLYPNLLGTLVESHFRQVMEERTPREFEQYFHQGDSEKWYHFQAYPQPGEGLIIYMRETTEKRRAEQALRRSEQLAAAGRLAASIAHEINNPLEAVTNLLFLAKMDEQLNGQTRGLLDVADRELQRLSHITARSLKFYRQRTAPAEAAADDLIESVLFFHETEIRLRSIDLRRRYRPVPQILCMAGEIQQVITNLISNALEAVQNEGAIEIRLTPGADSAGREGVYITIADSGSGMDRYTLERLFQPFVTTKGDEGTGLGLWVSKGIIDKHQGKIKVHSRSGVGSVFRIFLPLRPKIDDLDPLSLN